MKVYLATSGDQEYGHEVHHVFAARKDAENYPLADQVEEFDLTEGPVAVGQYVTATWRFGKPEPSMNTQRYDLVGDPTKVSYTWGSGMLTIQGWGKAEVLAEFDRLQDQYEAARRKAARAKLAELDPVEVKVWYVTPAGDAVLHTPLHCHKDHFEVPSEQILREAGLPDNATLHGAWFTVDALSYTEVSGFKARERSGRPDESALAADWI